ncbi:MAG TPA: gluconate 2-dehydrogenase subunit 3 family protein [Lacunisphaera sp.]|nr:gluconate 2-dehydrogenase subunit 3 family protein [Lacunisphaera sp.]
MNSPALLSRREALARLALVMGGAVIGADVFLRGAPLEGKIVSANFSSADILLLDEIGETIIPTTDTPGAKAVGIGGFMAMMVNDCYDDAHHAAFMAGLVKVNAASRRRFNQDFMAITPQERTTLLNEIDAEQRQHTANKSAAEPAHYFRMMKQLTLLGYFTSEVGASKTLRFVEVPGSYDGNAVYRKGDRAWFIQPSRVL